MFKKKARNIPDSLEKLCNFEPSIDDWALIEEAFCYAVVNEDIFYERVKQRNPKEYKRLWKRYIALRHEDRDGHDLIGFLFMKRSPETADNVCKRFTEKF